MYGELARLDTETLLRLGKSLNEHTELQYLGTLNQGPLIKFANMVPDSDEFQFQVNEDFSAGAAEYQYLAEGQEGSSVPNQAFNTYATVGKLRNLGEITTQIADKVSSLLNERGISFENEFKGVTDDGMGDVTEVGVREAEKKYEEHNVEATALRAMAYGGDLRRAVNDLRNGESNTPEGLTRIFHNSDKIVSKELSDPFFGNRVS
ncbi:MAG: hypothetical protein RIR76_223 [Verrucomicrobiota bacterium]|jgi:hypothetical protein